MTGKISPMLFLFCFYVIEFSFAGVPVGSCFEFDTLTFGEKIKKVAIKPKPKKWIFSYSVDGKSWGKNQYVTVSCVVEKKTSENSWACSREDSGDTFTLDIEKSGAQIELNYFLFGSNDDAESGLSLSKPLTAKFGAPSMRFVLNGNPIDCKVLPY